MTDVVLREVSEPYKILVKGTFKSDKISKVHRYFAKFGIVSQKVISEERRTTIEYCCAKLTTYLQVIQIEHFVCDQKLKVFPLVPLREKIENAHISDLRLAIIKDIIEYPTFTTQVDVLQRHLQAGKVLIDNRTLVQSDLSCALSSKFGKIKASFFDLNVPSDNLDIYLDKVKDKNNRLATLQELKNLVGNARNMCQVSLISNSLSCRHVSTQTSCVINLGNEMVEINHFLVKYYLSIDDKIQQLMIIIKFWADSYDLIGVDCFSNYSFCLMVIFYLQQDPYKLPSVKTLQENTTPNLVNGWNCAYAEFIDFTNSHLENATILDLVTGFFKFYSKFDYISFVISPYFGSALEKIRFLRPYDLPQCFTQFVSHNKNLEVNSGLCIQDFFEHSRNVSISVPLDLMGNFTILCRSALQLVEKGEECLLYKLLLHCQNGAMVEFQCFILEKDKKTTNVQEWKQSVKKVTMRVLSNVLNFKVSEVSSFGSECFSFSCVGQHSVSDNRIKIWKTLSKESHVGIEREVAITNGVIEDCPLNISWKISVELTFMKKPYRVKVLFTKMGGSFNMNHICHFLYTRLVTLLAEEETSDVSRLEPLPAPLIDLTKENERTSDDDATLAKYSPKNKNKLKSVEEGELSKADEEDDDDVASDFFDDFYKEDFLNGLDIVHACDYDFKVSDVEDKDKTKSKRRPHEKSLSKERRSVKKRRKKYLRSKSKSRSPVKRRRSIRSRSQSRTHSRRRSSSTSCSSRCSRSRSRDGKRRKIKRCSTSSSSTDKSCDRTWNEKKYSWNSSSSSSFSPCQFNKRKNRLRYRYKRRSSDSLSPQPKSRRFETTKKKSLLEKIRDTHDEIIAAVPLPPPITHSFPPYLHKTQLVLTPESLPVHNSILHPIPSLLPNSIPSSSLDRPFVPPPCKQSYGPRSFIGGTTVPIVTNSIPDTPSASAPSVEPSPPPPLPSQPPSPPPSVLSVQPCLAPYVVPVIQQKISFKSSAQSDKLKLEPKKQHDLAKVFAGKKISTSDLPSITAKREAVAKSSNPMHTHEKDKLISRCQDVLKLLTVEPLPQLVNQPQTKCYGKIPKIRFTFTTPPKWNGLGSSFSQALIKILQKVGIDNREDNVGDIVDSVVKVLNSHGVVNKERMAMILRSTLLGSIDSELTEKTGVGIQCEVDMKSVGVQVQEEDLNLGGLLSNDSIVCLTSAYLLEIDKKSIFSNENLDGREKNCARDPRRRL